MEMTSCWELVHEISSWWRQWENQKKKAWSLFSVFVISVKYLDVILVFLQINVDQQQEMHYTPCLIEQWAAVLMTESFSFINLYISEVFL